MWRGLIRGLFGAATGFVGLSQKTGAMCLVALEADLVLYQRFGAVERMLPAP